MGLRDLGAIGASRIVVGLASAFSPPRQGWLFRWSGWLSRRQPVRIGTTRFGAVMRCDLRDYIPFRIYFFGTWEPAITRLIADTLRPGDTFVDVGANIGYDTLLGSSRVGPAGRVIAIEASRGIFAKLEDNVALNGATNVRAVNMAVSDRAGELRLYNDSDTNLGRTSSLQKPGSELVETVPMLPLDEILTEEERQAVRLIKVDIEGGELPLLRRLVETLDLYSPDMQLVVEMSQEQGPELVGIFDRLLAAGFEARAIMNEYAVSSYMAPDAPVDPVPITRLPETQMDVHFRRAATP